MNSCILIIISNTKNIYKQSGKAVIRFFIGLEQGGDPLLSYIHLYEGLDNKQLCSIVVVKNRSWGSDAFIRDFFVSYPVINAGLVE